MRSHIYITPPPATFWRVNISLVWLSLPFVSVLSSGKFRRHLCVVYEVVKRVELSQANQPIQSPYPRHHSC